MGFKIPEWGGMYYPMVVWDAGAHGEIECRTPWSCGMQEPTMG